MQLNRSFKGNRISVSLLLTGLSTAKSVILKMKMRCNKFYKKSGGNVDGMGLIN